MPQKILNKITVPVLISILLAGAAIKFKFLFQGSLWPDEALYLYIARNLFSDMTNLTSMSGHMFFQSPPVLMYLIAPLANIKFVEFDQAARAAVIIMGVGTILTTCFICKKTYHPLVGIIAASFLAVCPLSNWTGVRILTDIPVVFFIYLAMCMLVYEKKTAFYFFGMCAVLTKYSAFPVLFLPLLMRLKPKAWASLYLSGFVVLGGLVAAKGLYPKPAGWLGYFYGFFHVPDLLHMFKETEFFLGYFITGFILLGFYFSIKEEKFSALFHWVCIFGLCRIFLPWVVFRVSRYSLPLYPGLYIIGAYGCYRSGQLIAEKWPIYAKWATLFFVVSIACVLYQHSMKSMGMLEQTKNTFVGYDKAAQFLKSQTASRSVATASPRQIGYFAPEFDVHDIGKNMSPKKLRKLLERENIQYLSIDFWSPHLPSWCRSFNYKENGYDLIYKGRNIYVFKVL